jgi:predicted GNAT family N-acyltransferase
MVSFICGIQLPLSGEAPPREPSLPERTTGPRDPISIAGFFHWPACGRETATRGLIRDRLTMTISRATEASMEHATAIKVVEINDGAKMEMASAIRRIVFIEEQQVPAEIEQDEDDAHALHVLALQGETPVGCGRMVAHGDYVKIGRMAVLRERRRCGVGRQVLNFLMNAARQQGFRKAVLHAQLTAEGFYLRNGYVAMGDAFEEAGIMHRLMEREL